MGLDDAIDDLKRAIEALPEDPVKKRLKNGYRQLKEVRNELSCQPEAGRVTRLALMTMICLSVFIIGYLVYRLKK